MSFLDRLVDERFWAHRQRSTSIAGMISTALALVMFAWRYYVEHVWSWELLAVGLTFVATKLAVMTWSALRD